ncbi:alpha/beta fold hydrolase [Mycobacterium sp.]|uniref:alpha/beta fold hydrolase n=1 Tax=Mycobacterium sp. TaxID=1785 RepID=UPI003BA92C32
MRALCWGPTDGRLALCLHGFPDSAHGWRLLGPMLAQHGMRVVAPFTRGYWPTELPDDGDYHMGALMADALALHRHFNGGDDAILIGHDWGAWTTNAIAALPKSPFGTHISLALPPVRAIDPSVHPLGRRLIMAAIQLRMSWYIPFFQIPALPLMALAETAQCCSSKVLTVWHRC